MRTVSLSWPRAILLLMVIPLALCSCSVARPAGRDFFDGAKDAAKAYLQSEEGKDDIQKVADTAVDLATAPLVKKQQELQQKVVDGTATRTERIAEAALTALLTYLAGRKGRRWLFPDEKPKA